MKIRNYKPTDCAELVDLFNNTVKSVNKNDYTNEQITAWIKNIDIEK